MTMDTQDIRLHSTMTVLSTAPTLSRAALFLALLCLPLGLAALVDPRLFQDESTWIKPLKFSASLSLYLYTLVWGAQFLPEGLFQTARMRAFHAIVLFCIASEMLWIAGAALFATGSHFNVGTPVMATLYGVMGVAAFTLTSAALVHGILILRNAATPFAKLVGASFALTFALTVPVAFYMSSGTGHFVGTHLGRTLPLLGWSRDAGDLRIAHFFATHAMQILPLIYLAIARFIAPPRASTTVLLAGYSALTVVTWGLAASGRPLIP